MEQLKTGGGAHGGWEMDALQGGLAGEKVKYVDRGKGGELLDMRELASPGIKSQRSRHLRYMNVGGTTAGRTYLHVSPRDRKAPSIAC